MLIVLPAVSIGAGRFGRSFSQVGDWILSSVGALLINFLVFTIAVDS
jgi:hypothetical protein